MTKNSKQNKSKLVMTTDEWAEKFSADLASDVYYALEDQIDVVGEKGYNLMLAQFLSGYIAAICYRALTYAPKDVVDKEDRYNYAKKNYADMKTRICEAVAAGVSGGMQTWCGKTLDYYCQIKVVPEPTSKAVN